MKRILVTGSRDWDNEHLIEQALRDAYWDLLDEGADPAVSHDVTLVHGDCRGADIIARDIWRAHGKTDEAHPAPWKTHGKAAGFVRNAEMVDLGADLCLAFIKNDSKGASMAASLAEKAGIPVRRFTA